ncbi:MFS transporter [Streptomyces sp. S186]|uniref:MFS transporter n=1 Tax=Streptomyces sp. S186 TaxID=3434395 RepID=UPI003F661909
MAVTLRPGRAASFWFLGATLAAVIFAAGAPSPLYVVYQAQWGFSAGTLTVVFAVFVFALLLALLTVGRLSDHIGRRPVVTAALLAEALSMVLFIAADKVGWLMAARAVQGLAAGAAMGPLSAGLVDLQPPRNPHLGALVASMAPPVGMATGALGSGLLVEYAPAPTTLVFAVLTAVFLTTAVGMQAVPETAVRRPGAATSLRPRIAVPRRIRRQFLALVPFSLAAWSLTGLFIALGPSLAVDVLHLSSHLTGGLTVAAAVGTGALGSVLARGWPPARSLTAGALTLATGTVLTLTALASTSAPLFFLGAAVSGLGYGAVFLGTSRTLAHLARPGERAGLFAAGYVINYLASGLPVIAAGLTASHIGLTPTALGYTAALAALAIGAATSARRATTSGEPLAQRPGNPGPVTADQGRGRPHANRSG